MKKKIFSIALLFVVGVSSLFLLAGCGKKKYDLELSYGSLPEHVTNIYVDGYEGKSAKYEKDGKVTVVAECEEGFEPSMTLKLGGVEVKEFSSYYCTNAGTASQGSYKYAYKYIVSAEGLSGAQTLNISADEKTAVYDLKFSIEGNFNANDEKFAGLKFYFTGLATEDVVLTVSELVEKARTGGSLKYTYGKEFTCTISADNKFLDTNFLVDASSGITSDRKDSDTITFTATAEAVIKFVPAQFIFG